MEKPSSTSDTARQLANDAWGRRFARHLAVECGHVLADAVAALEASLDDVLRKVSPSPPAILLPRVADTVLADLYKGEPPPPNPSEKRIRESKAIRAFARRVRERSRNLQKSLTRELLAHSS